MNKSITLTSSMRSNLSALKTISTQMDKTQKILSSGKKVNSAIDNASSYYQARSLTNRANDLSSLLDSMSQSIQTIQAATQGLESGLTFIEQMSSVASQALSIAQSYQNDMDAKVINSVSKINSSMSTDEIQEIFSRPAKVVWECANCGCRVETSNAPAKCPVCDHPQAYFFELQEQF